MFLNRQYIPAVPIQEEQRLSEEEELARQLKREASIFFPDSKLPDFSTRDLPSLPEEEEQEGGQPSGDYGKTDRIRKPSAKSPDNGEKEGQEARPADVIRNRKPDSVIIADHDAVCREEDSIRMYEDGRFSPHELQNARQEAEQIAKNRKERQAALQSEEPSLQIEGNGRPVPPRLNKQEIKRGIRLSVILDRPRGMKPWKEDIF